jgi:gp16 family phage-associated protein
MKLKTPDEVKEMFYKKGISLTEWARTHNIPRHVVSDLLRGKCIGRRGQSHKAAVLLGIKDGNEADCLNSRQKLNNGADTHTISGCGNSLDNIKF